MPPLAAILFPFRRLAVWLGCVVVGLGLIVVGVAYLLVIPSLKDNLVDDRLRALDKSAAVSAHSLRFTDAGTVQGYEASSGYRIAVLQGEPDFLLPIGGSIADGASDPLVVSAIRSRRSQLGIVGEAARANAEYAEVVHPPTGASYVLLVRSSLADISRTVGTVERRLLVAVAIALPLAWLVGAAAALLLARRIRRLERAAARIAAGSFDRAVVDGGRDEVAQLARAFDDMRVRLERTDRARRDFIASASHELRTPIFALGGFLELLEDEGDPATQREYIATMRDQVTRLTRLATDLLDLSRLDAGARLDRVDVDLAGVAETTARDFAAAAERRSATVEVAGSSALALGDETRLGQICRVLVDNALRHNPRGVHVTIGCAVRDGHAVLRVADDGPAIPPATRARLFDRFYRGPGSSEGSGLGLAIARELALRMDGSLALVQSDDEKAFELALPLASAAPAAALTTG